MTGAHSWLTPDEAAARLSISPRHVRRRVTGGQLPALIIGRVVRIEARALDASAPEPVPGRYAFAPRDLARLWRISYRTVLDLATAGALPARRVAGVWRVRRDDLVAFVRDHAARGAA